MEGNQDKTGWIAPAVGALPVESDLYGGGQRSRTNLTFNRWNAALALASFLDANVGKYEDRHVLELGAGGALPSIVAVKNGARKVCTIYRAKYLLLNAADSVFEGGCHRLPR